MGTTVLERENSATIEEREHEKQISENYQKLIADRNEQKSYYDRSDYNTAATAAATLDMRRAQQNIPSAAKRLADYVPYTVGMTKIQRMGDMPAYTSPKVVDYAPVQEAQTQTEEAAPAKAALFEGLTFRDGQLYDMNATTLAPETAPEVAPEIAPSPAYEPSYMPEYDPSIIPSEEDALPTQRTMESLRSLQEEEQSVGFFASLSTKTKTALAVVGAVILLLIALVCVNTAVLNSLSADIGVRQVQIEQLTQQADSIRAQIDELTDPENIAIWAEENGMTLLG